TDPCATSARKVAQGSVTLTPKSEWACVAARPLRHFLLRSGQVAHLTNPRVIRICLKTSTTVKNTGRIFHTGRRMEVPTEYMVMTTKMTTGKKVCVCRSTSHDGRVFS